jgi:hypothetical protein
MRFTPQEGQVYAYKTQNAQVWPHPPLRVIPRFPTPAAQLVRFGVAHVLALVTLELGLTRRMDGWDAEWYDGEVLRRLRARLFRDPIYRASFRDAEHRRTADGHFDWLANTYQLESLDLDAVLTIGKRRYYEILLAVLRSIYRDEGIRGELTAQVLRRYRFSRRAWPMPGER